MKLHQRSDRISLKDQGFNFASAAVIGKRIIGKNDNLVKIDLSNNQLQQNFRPIVKGIKNSKRLISLTMKNNQLHGPEHALDIKEIIKNHPTLSFIDFSNNEMNINKNKLKNIGAQAIVEGILESQEHGCSLISAINLGYNLLTSDCLRHFARLSDPSFIQLNSLNLSYNDLGQDSILMLQPILSDIVELNLSGTKMTNKSL